jgi:hypothetical protein
MSQIIRLNESDLLNIVKRVLLEGKKDNPEKRVKSSYQLMIDGAAGGGTNPKHIISGIKKLKNKEEFYRLNYLFKDNKTGYKSFNEMIKGEFEYVKIFGLNNSDDFETLKKEFNRLGVEMEDVKSKKEGFKFINLGKGNNPLAGGDESDDESDNESDNESELDDDNDTKKEKKKKTGCIKGDCKNGYGTYTYPDGEKYVGHFKNGKQNGYGTYTYPDGIKYVGNNKDDEWSGYGTMTWPNGHKYAGNYKGSLRDGYGTYTYSDGRKYVGNFKAGEYGGYGTYTNIHGIKFSGNWVDDTLDGKSTNELDELTENNNSNNNNQNTTTCDQPQKPLYKYKDDKMYEYAKSGDCWWAQNVKSKKWFNLTELVKTRPNIQVSIDRLNTAETNNELIMITGS